MNKTALISGTILAALAVVLGAFGAHSLKQVISDVAQLQTFEAGVRYQMYHSFALLATGILSATYNNKWTKWAATLFILGIFCFSGSLYAIVALKLIGVVGLASIGIITPIGGLFFIAAWLCLMLGILHKETKN